MFSLFVCLSACAPSSVDAGSGQAPIVSAIPHLVNGQRISAADGADPIDTVSCTANSNDDLFEVADVDDGAQDGVLELLGLAPSTTYDCTTDDERAFSFTTEPLPDVVANAARWTVDGADDVAAPFYTLLNYGEWSTASSKSDQLLLVDHEGVVRWYLDLPGDPAMDAYAELLPSASGIPSIFFGGANTIAPTTASLDGTSVVQLDASPATDGTFNHDALWLPDGHLLTLTKVPNTSAGPDGAQFAWDGFELAIWDFPSSTKVWTFDSQQLVDDGVLDVPVSQDPWHANGLALLDDATVLVSLNELSQLFAIDFETGSVLWRLGGGGAAAGDFMLVEDTATPRWFTNQHAPAVLPGASADHFDLLLYDNGDGSQPTRAVRFSIDVEARTATQTWEWTMPGADWSEPTLGDVDASSDLWGTVITLGHCAWCEEATETDRSTIVEVDEATGATAWGLTFNEPAAAVYRSERYDGCAVFATNKRFCP